MYTLHIGNKNYSSWSLRPWVLMRALGISFEEKLHFFGSGFKVKESGESPSGRVPALHDGKRIVWDSLAIAEYLAERHPGVWPADDGARAYGRCAAAEMHSSFARVRNDCSMSCGVRIELHAQSTELQAEVARLAQLWGDGISQFGGPFICGKSFTAADAFFCPVAFRVQTYGLALPPVAAAYVDTLLAVPAMQEWYEAALVEEGRDFPHEAEIIAAGRLKKDFRKPQA